MAGISNLDVSSFQDKINCFKKKYVRDWNEWLETEPDNRVIKFGEIMQKWQACRPNTMRRTRNENMHPEPYLEDLISEATKYLETLHDFDISCKSSFSEENKNTLTSLWDIFQNLSYKSSWSGLNMRDGLAGEVGISKAVLLLTDGRIGPAFDSSVKNNLNIKHIDNAKEWIDALLTVNGDIQKFENKNKISIKEATPFIYKSLHTGRIYDMALGPGNE